MSIVTGTVTVNAAFLQEIKEDNRELRRLLGEASGFASQSFDDRRSLKQWAKVLGGLRDQLALHFSLEEAYGYFDDAVNVAPRLSTRADALRGEHELLFKDICALVEQAEQLLYRESAAVAAGQMVQKFLAFRHRFQDHETREDELILQSLDDDIGVGD